MKCFIKRLFHKYRYNNRNKVTIDFQFGTLTFKKSKYRDKEKQNDIQEHNYGTR